MNKLIFFLYRLPHLDHEAFCRAYLREHVPLALEHCRGLRRFVVDLIDGEPRGDGAFDGVAHFWVDELEDFTDRSRFYNSEASRAAVRDHAAGLVRAAVGYHVDETIQRDYERTWPDGEPSPGVKMIAPMIRVDGLTHEQFAERWLTRHAPTALEHVPGIWRYVTNVVLAPLSRGAPEIDGIVEVHRRSAADLKLRPTPESQKIIDADTDALIVRPARTRATEHVIKS